MRLGELQKPIDILEISLIEAQNFLNNNPHLIVESAYDNKEYREKINTEKLHTVKINTLIKNQHYVPTQILGIPAGKYIHIQTTENNVKFITEYNNKLHFQTSHLREIIFPSKDADMGDQCSDILIFNNINERDQFLSVLKLSFADWMFKITNR